MAQAQHLHVLQQQSRLLDAQADTAGAAHHVEQCAATCVAAEQALDDLMQQGLFCPSRYAIMGGAMLAAEAEKQDGIVQLNDFENIEQEQRRAWQKRRDQADWIDTETRNLRKRIMRDDDDKRARQAIDLLVRRRVKA